MSTILRLDVDFNALLKQLNTTKEILNKELRPGIQRIAAATHGFVVEQAKANLSGWHQDFFLTPSGGAKDDPYKFVKFQKIAEDLYVVYITQEVLKYDEGAPATSMATPEWLLKPGKVKTAKDGSTYRVIPMSHTRYQKKDGQVIDPNSLATYATTMGQFSNKLGTSGTMPAYETMIERAAKSQGIKINGPNSIQYGPDGKTPLVGVMDKLRIPEPDRRSTSSFSMPRDKDVAESIGLAPHDGIFKLAGAVVTQRLNAKGAAVREVMTFRVVSSKHKAEGRWMAPAIPAGRYIEKAYEFAEKRVDMLLKDISKKLGPNT